MNSRLRVIITGLIAQYPLGGVTWDYVQYAAGLKRLGHDVYYIEDTGQWPYNPVQSGVAKDCEFNVAYLADVMSRFGLDGRWAYRFPWESQWFGMPEALRRDVIRTADLLINVSGTLERPDAYRSATRMAYIDSDPVFTQVKLMRGQDDLRKMIETHDRYFSFGERLRDTDMTAGIDWQPTRQPVLLDEWRHEGRARDVFTTVMNWTSYNEVRHAGITYAQKDVEFRRFLDLPSAVAPIEMEVAMSSGRTRHAPMEMLSHNGWRVVDPSQVCGTMDDYRRYLQTSMAEWSVAKGGYVTGRAGWFSCRSACYLAAGRPVVVQDTGFSPMLPSGEGICAFATPEEAATGVRDVVARYDAHARAARDIAHAYFDSDKVLADLVERAMSPVPLLQEAAR